MRLEQWDMSSVYDIDLGFVFDFGLIILPFFILFRASSLAFVDWFYLLFWMIMPFFFYLSTSVPSLALLFKSILTHIFTTNCSNQTLRDLIQWILYIFLSICLFTNLILLTYVWIKIEKLLSDNHPNLKETLQSPATARPTRRPSPPPRLRDQTGSPPLPPPLWWNQTLLPLCPNPNRTIDCIEF